MIFLHIIKQALFIFIILFLVTGFFLGSDRGFKLTSQAAIFFTDKKVGMSSVKGNLIDGFDIHDLSLDIKGQTVFIKTIEGALNAKSLLAFTIDLRRINITDVTIDASNNNNEEAPEDNSNGAYEPLALSWPSWLKVNDFTLERFVLRDKQHVYILEKLQHSLSDKSTLHWKNFRAQKQNKLLAASDTGSLSFTPNTSSFTINLLSDINIPGAGKGELSLNGKLTNTQIESDTFSILLDSGLITGQGHYRWNEKLDWGLSLRAKELTYTSRHTGTDIRKLQFTVDATGSNSSSTTRLTNLTAEVNKTSIDGEFSIDIDNGTLIPQRLALNSKASPIIKFEKNINGHFAYSLFADIPDLSQFADKFKGRLSANGDFFFTGQWPKVNGAIHLDNFKSPHHNIESLRLVSNIDTKSSKPSNIELDIVEANAFDHNFSKAKLSYVGTTDANSTTVKIVSPDKKLETKLKGSFDTLTFHKPSLRHPVNVLNWDWRGSLDQLTIDSKQFDIWRLNHTPEIHISNSKANIEEFCLQRDNTPAKLCANLSTDNITKYSSVSFGATQFPIGMLSPLIRYRINASNTLDAKFSFERDSDNFVTLSSAAKLSPGTLTLFVNHQPYPFHLQISEFKANLNKKGGAADLDIKLDKQQFIQSHIKIPNFYGFSQAVDKFKLNGLVEYDISDIALLRLVHPRLDTVTGRIKGRQRIKGGIFSPELIGKTKLIDATATFPSWGLEVKDINANINLSKQNEYDFTGHATSGKGKINFIGDGQLSIYNNSVNLDITGENFRILDTEDYIINANPALNLDYENQRLAVDGDILLPSGEIKPRSFSDSKVKVSLPSDVIFEDDDEEDSTGSEIYTKIKLTAGDRVRLKLWGITGNVVGSVLLTDSPNTVLRAEGELNVIKGRYLANGQDLKITKGSLNFPGGALTALLLNVEATKEITVLSSSANRFTEDVNLLDDDFRAQVTQQGQQVTLGVQIRGRISEPKVTLFSNPGGYSQADILSLLLFERTIGQNSNDETNALIHAANAIRLDDSESASIIQQIQNKIGLDTISIESTVNPISIDSDLPEQADEDLTNTSLVIGKRIADQLFINYSIGLKQPINILKLKYLLGKKWVLQTETSERSDSVDLFYTFEKD